MGGGEGRAHGGVPGGAGRKRGQQPVRADGAPLGDRAEPRLRERGPGRRRGLPPVGAQLGEARSGARDARRRVCARALQEPGGGRERRGRHVRRAQPHQQGQAPAGRPPRHRAQRGRPRHRTERRGVVRTGGRPGGHAHHRVDPVAARAERAAQLRHRHVALPVTPGGQDRAQLPGEVGARLGLVREEGADPGGDRHRGGELGVGRARVAVQEPDVAEHDTPMAYGQADTAPEDPRGRGRRDADRGRRPGDAEALEPLPHRRRRTAGQDRAGADRVHGRGIEVALAVVRAEGDQLEVAVLQRRRGAEQLGDLVDEVLVLTHRVGRCVFRRHRGILPYAPGPFIHLSEICGTDA
ncbi:hypothetical protein SsS58_07392 [Streptomyces scabiei]|uniref:Uncharacterized protein n=1 Tax=Streptomyces scabiei TaxID=1930 RepID=A0A117EGC7_STRSC|nr:hypothetical protein SsS58_07392 [Streptomyces scabiei]